MTVRYGDSLQRRRTPVPQRAQLLDRTAPTSYWYAPLPEAVLIGRRA